MHDVYPSELAGATQLDRVLAAMGEKQIASRVVSSMGSASFHKDIVF
jgi:hypothetical protein